MPLETRIAELSGLDEVGLVTDLPPWQIPVNAASDIQNVRFNDGAAEAIYQHRSILSDTFAIDGLTAYQSGKGFGRQIIWANSNGDLKIYGTDDGAVYTVYTGATPITWSGNTQKWSWHTSVDMAFACHADQYPLYLVEPEGRWYGTPVANNFALLPWDDTPQTWADVDKTAVGLRSLANQLIAFNTIESGVNYSARIRWSEPYLPGDVPRTWDEGDTSSICGYYDISDTEGPIWDLLSLKTSAFVYKADGVWRMFKTGGDDIYGFEAAFPNMRALISDCVCNLGDGRHLVVTPDDVLVHNGVDVSSVATGLIRSRLFGALNGAALVQVQAEYLPLREEAWITFPEGSTVDTALIWNKVTGSWSERQIPSIRQLARMRPESVTTRDGDFLTWAEYPIAGSSDNDIYELDTVTDAAGVAPTCYWERTGLSLENWTTHSFIRRIHLRMDNRIPVTVKVGYQMVPNGAVTWEATRTFDADTEKQITCRVGGFLPAIRIESSASAPAGEGPLWRFYGATIDYETQGSR